MAHNDLVTLDGWVDEMNKTQQIFKSPTRPLSPLTDYIEQPGHLGTDDVIEKQRRTIENYSNLVEQLGSKTKALENHVIDLEYENKELRGKLKQVYFKDRLVNTKEQDLTDDKENLGAKLEDLDLEDSETKKQQDGFEDLHLQIEILEGRIEKPHILVKENALLREKVEILEALQKVNPEVAFENSVLKETVSRVREELESTNMQIGMMVGRYEKEKEEMIAEHQAELAKKNKEIEELNATIQLMKQW